MPPLPAPLADDVARPAPGAGKRERTRAQLLAAAIQVISARGVAAATVQEIAAVTGMTTSTVYNHFATKDEVVQQVAMWLSLTLCERITVSQQGVKEGAERMAIGVRRYIWLAEQSPAWALLMLEVAAAVPQLVEFVQKFALQDIRIGVKQKSFRIESEMAALNMSAGATTQAMMVVARGLAPQGHASAVAATVLRGLGMPFEEAAAVAHRPLPALDRVDAAPAVPPVARKRATAASV